MQTSKGVPISKNTQLVLNYLNNTTKRPLKTVETAHKLGLSVKTVIAAISVLIRKGIIDKTPFEHQKKIYNHDMSNLSSLLESSKGRDFYSTQPLMNLINNNQHIKDELVRLTNYLPEDTETTIRFYHYKNGPNIPTCKHCGEKVSFIKFSEGYHEFCSQSCSSQYKWDNDMTDEKIKDRSDKSRKSFKKNYGVDWYSKTTKHRNQISVYQNNPENRLKMNKTVEEKYGGYGLASEKTSKKIKASMKENHGVEYTWQIDEHFDKLQKARLTPKEYKFPSGRIELIQGFEHFALDDLLKKYDETDIIVSNKEIVDYTGFIMYDNNGKSRRYFPDIYIKSVNKIIEVKSEYTYNGTYFGENMLKRKACLDAGFDFEFLIYDRKGNLLDLK